MKVSLRKLGSWIDQAACIEVERLHKETGAFAAAADAKFKARVLANLKLTSALHELELPDAVTMACLLDWITEGRTYTYSPGTCGG